MEKVTINGIEYDIIVDNKGFLKGTPINPKTIWDIEVGEEYWFVARSGLHVDYFFWENGEENKSYRLIGNAFLTKEEAEFEIEKRKFLTKMKREFEENRLQPFNLKGDERKYHLVGADDCTAVSVAWSLSYHMTPIEFLTNNKTWLSDFADKNQEDILKYYFGV